MNSPTIAELVRALANFDPGRGRRHAHSGGGVTDIITRTKAGAKLETLTRAGLDERPACEGDEMFIAERAEVTATDLQRMRKLCRTCPLFDLCSDYARTAKPGAGFWAGIPYGKPERPRAAEEGPEIVRTPEQHQATG